MTQLQLTNGRSRLEIMEYNRVYFTNSLLLNILIYGKNFVKKWNVDGRSPSLFGDKISI
jgi:hypothetical protein